MDALNAPAKGGSPAGLTDTVTWRDGVTPPAGDTLSQVLSVDAVHLSTSLPLFATLSSALRAPEQTRVLPPVAGVQKKKLVGLSAIVGAGPGACALATLTSREWWARVPLLSVMVSCTV